MIASTFWKKTIHGAISCDQPTCFDSSSCSRKLPAVWMNFFGMIGAIDDAHTEVFGAKPERDTVRWFSDASALTRYGIESVNYGTSSGLPDQVLGENLDVDGLVKIAQVYALVAQRVCGVA
jgi:hypothetical protein